MSIFDNRPNIPIEKIQDPNTGQIIYRTAVEPKYTDEAIAVIKKHQETMNAFVMNSQQFFMGMKIQLQLIDKIQEADKDIKTTLNNIVKKAKLDPKKPWEFQLDTKLFQYRESPIVDISKDANLFPTNVQNPAIPIK